MKSAAVRWFAVVALVSGCAGVARLDPRQAVFSSPAFHPPVPVETVLPSGVPVFLLEDHTVPLVRILLAAGGGSLYDPPDQAGLAEVLELSWRTGGAGELGPEEVDESVENRGMTLSISVGRDEVWIRLSVLPQDLAAGLDLLGQVVQQPAFREDRVRWAVSQVSERVRREDDDPQSLAFRELRKALYRGHPRGVVPSLESLQRVGRTDVAAVHARLLRESRWVAGAVGDFDPQVLVREIGQRFGHLAAHGSGFSAIPAPDPPSPRLILVPRDLAQATFLWARLGPGRLDPAFYPLEVVNHALGGGGFQSRLVSEIRSDRGLAYSVGSFYQGRPTFGVLGVHAATSGDSLEEVIDLVGSVLDRLREDGLEPDELARAQAALINRHVFRYEDLATTVQDRMRAHLKGLPEDLPAQYPVRIGAVSVASAAAISRLRLDRAAGVVVVVGNADEETLRQQIPFPLEVVKAP